MDNFGNRKVVFKALVGSHNYNLNDETSDKDYKYFVMPTFDDLYKGKMFSASKVGTTEDYDVHDVRKLVDLFWKANVNFLEVLYSKDFEWHISSAQTLFRMRQEIVTMNLPYLYSACKGMYFEKMKRLEKGTEGTQHLVDKYGYDTKQALHAYRVRDFCIRFAENDFSDFNDAMRYETDEFHQMLLDIKHGKFSRSEFDSILYLQDEYFVEAEAKFKSQSPNLETKAKLEQLIKNLVRDNL